VAAIFLLPLSLLELVPPTHLERASIIERRTEKMYPVMGRKARPAAGPDEGGVGERCRVRAMDVRLALEERGGSGIGSQRAERPGSGVVWQRRSWRRAWAWAWSRKKW
jgi:hypothetical protein